MLQSFVASLKRFGYDLVAPFSGSSFGLPHLPLVQEYNAIVQKRFRLHVFSQTNTLAMLVGT